MSGGMHDDPSIFPHLPGKAVDASAAWLMDVVADDSDWRACWEYVLSHEMTEGEKSAFWHGAILAHRAVRS